VQSSSDLVHRPEMRHLAWYFIGPPSFEEKEHERSSNNTLMARWYLLIVENQLRDVEESDWDQPFVACRMLPL
jgi:hypothetical protein